MADRRRTVCARRNTEIGSSGEFVLEGAVGKLVSTRKLPSDRERMALVKWRGRTGHCCHPMSALELLE